MSTNKVAVITGAARGIGKAVAEAFVARGYRVVIGDVIDDVGTETVKELNRNAEVAFYKHCDVTSYAEQEALFRFAAESFGGIDVAILNAGVAEIGGPFLAQEDLEVGLRNLDVNTSSVIRGTKVALPHLHKRGGGVLIFTASIVGLGTNYFSSLFPIYTASKHAVVGWTRSLAIMKDAVGVRVCAICPSWVETDIIKMSSGFVDAENKVPMSTVVNAFLLAIDDPSINGDCILALPHGVEVERADQRRYGSEASEEVKNAYWKEIAAAHRETLDTAVAKLNI